MATAKTPGTRSDIVTLSDLAPTHDVRGGARRRVFGEESPLGSRPTSHVGKGEYMETSKKPGDQSDSAEPTTNKPLKVNQDTLKDLEPEARDAQHVKGGIPPKLTPGL